MNQQGQKPSSTVELVTRNAGNVFDKLGSYHSLISQRTHAEPNLKCSLELPKPEISALKKCIADLEARSKGVVKEYIPKRHSFTEDILVKPLLEKLKIPQLITCEWKEDLLNHLDKYTLWMVLQGANDAIMCHAFPLGDKAQRCFRRLHQRFWNDLATSFLA